MATKKTTKKAAPVQEAPVEVEVKKPARKFKPGDMIPCKCVRPNRVIFHSQKTDSRYVWFGYGDIVEVDYADLLAMKSAKMAYLYKPLIIIMDDELVAQWARDLADLYSSYIVYDNLEDFFELSNEEFEEQLINSTPGFRELIKIVTAKKIKDESLDSRKKIQIIDEVLGTDFYEFS